MLYFQYFRILWSFLNTWIVYENYALDILYIFSHIKWILRILYVYISNKNWRSGNSKRKKKDFSMIRSDVCNDRGCLVAGAYERNDGREKSRQRLPLFTQITRCPPIPACFPDLWPADRIGEGC